MSFLTFTTALPCGISVRGSINTDRLKALTYLPFFLRIRTTPDNDLEKSGTVSLYNKPIQHMLLICFKCLNISDYPKYLKELLTRHFIIYSLRGTNILSLSKPVSTTYCLHSFRFSAAKTWNSLRDTIRKHDTLSEFKNDIKKLDFKS